MTSGWINICTYQRSSLQVAPFGGECNKPNVIGCTIYRLTTNEPTVHINAMMMGICGNCNMNATQLRNDVHHEYGHAIGLGHSNDTNDLMYKDLPADHYVYANADDNGDLSSMYETLTANEVLGYNQQTRSANHYYRLIMQTDGNLVMYAGGANGGSAIWASNTRYVGTDNVIMQSDGNLVVRAGTVPACATGTWGSYGYLRVQSDGNLVVYNSANQAVWARSWGSTCH